MVVFLQKLFRVIFCWGRPQQKGDVKSAELIVGHAMSDLVGGKTSVTNLDLAHLALRYHSDLGIPIFPQAEIAKPLMAWGVSVVGETPIDSDASPFSAQYAGTIGISKIQRDFCRERGWNRVLVLAPWPHAWRAIWTYERLGLEVVIPPDLPRMEFQKEMTQGRWRRAVTAYPYEFLVRVFYLFRGYI